MRKVMPSVLEAGRIRQGPLASDWRNGWEGAFFVSYKNATLAIISSHGDGWDHVSVSLERRTPTWEEMCYVKDLYFNEEECVIQYHPPKSVYKNVNPYTLHMWRKQGENWELPPDWMV